MGGWRGRGHLTEIDHQGLLAASSSLNIRAKVKQQFGEKGWLRFALMDFNINRCDSSKGKDTLIQLLLSSFLINRRFVNVLAPAIYLLKLDQLGLANFNRPHQVLKCQTNVDRNTKQNQARDGWMDYRMEGAPN